MTHALMAALNEDRHLLARFLRELVKVKPPSDVRKLMILEQRYPEEEEPNEEELERRGVPDGWIFDEDGWCVFIESKVISTLQADQINRHRRTAESLGFHNITAVAIAPRLPSFPPANTRLLEWRTIYAWLRQYASKSSSWAARAAEFLEIAEAKLIDTEKFAEGTLTMFSGFPFGHDRPLAYLEGKRVLDLALGELRGRRDLRQRLGMNPKVPGRPAITGRHGNSVWDFLSLAASGERKSFTKYPHLTLQLESQAIEAMVTVPNAVNTKMRRNLIELGEEGFQALVMEVIGNLKPLLRDHKGAKPWFRGLQRRYPSQRAIPFLDARIDFDLRTAVPSGRPIKAQSRWLSAAYGSFVNKDGANYQIQMGVQFPYDRCPELGRPSAINLIATAWLGCKPLVDLAK